MAALMRHGLFKTQLGFNAQQNLARSLATKIKRPNPDKKKTPIIDSTAESLAAKGFLRAQAAYNPPEDVSQRLRLICQEVLGSEEGVIKDINQRFHLLDACRKEFNHTVPNSLLHTMESTKDVLKFYQTPIIANTPLDVMKYMDLPPNLHIQYEPHRFHPETDTKFNGVTAFPRSSTLVTGLTSRKKYRGFEARTEWPYDT